MAFEQFRYAPLKHVHDEGPLKELCHKIQPN